MKRIAGLIAIALLSGCTQIPTGSVGIVKGFTGRISDEVAGQGLYLSLLTSYFPVDTTLTRATVDNMRPKDSHGVSLQDVSVVVSYRLDPARVAPFYRNSKEIDREPNSDLYTIGLEILEQSVIPYAVQIATEKSDLATISSHLADYAATIQNVADKRLRDLYPNIDPFVLQSVTVPAFELPPAIQAQMNAKAGYQAELETLNAQMQVIEQRKALKVAQASIDAAALAAAAKSTGLTPAEIIDWKRARAFELLAQHTQAQSVIINTAGKK
ncbi:MAG: hypothetical protein KGL34_05890 [Gammaproteobacteria bacterium]|nr:hypothetical protein [Gammaproteobacteria bacterium]